MPHSVNTYRQRAEVQFQRASSAPDDGARSSHLELARIFQARADLIASLSEAPRAQSR